MTELLDGELDALRSFCTVKIRKMHQQLISKQARGSEARKPQRGFRAERLGTSDWNCVVPQQLMNRIHLKNITETVQQCGDVFAKKVTLDAVSASFCLYLHMMFLCRGEEISKEEVISNIHTTSSIREALPITRRNNILQISALVLRYKQIILDEGVIEAQIHESAVCPDCQKKEAELAKITFLRQKKTLMENALIQEKLEELIYSRDVLTLIGEALRSFPKPSEDPRNLWQRLKDQKINPHECWT